jgi:hypothetical protein
MKIEILAMDTLTNLLQLSSDQEATALVTGKPDEPLCVGTPMAALLAVQDYDANTAQAIQAAIAQETESTQCGGRAGNINLLSPERTLLHDIEHLALVLARRGNIFGVTMAEKDFPPNQAIVALVGGNTLSELSETLEKSIAMINAGITLRELNTEER